MYRKHLLKKSLVLALVALMAFGVSGCKENRDSDVNLKYESTGEVTSRKFYMENEPESSYWFPAELLAWSPEKDPDLEYNVSKVPLAKRVDKENLTPVNSTQNTDTKIMAISIMNSHTSGNFPHGSNNVKANIFSYWQYIDELIYWGGSSGEGLIVPPSPDVTDMGHKNGVPVIGTVFFPQQVAGGKITWLDTFLQQESDGSFPLADKLAQVATIYGFDGWFINQETEGTEAEPLTKEHAEKMQLFIKYFKEKHPDLRIVYYDSMTKEGKMDWQNALTDENAYFMVDEDGNAVSDEMFLNFWWTNARLTKEKLLEKSAKKAMDLGLNPYDLYAGIDIQAKGYNTSIRWDLFLSGKNSTHTSLGIYCPSWAYETFPNLEKFHEAENVLWVNRKHDPSLEVNYSGNTQWRGMSMFVVENSVLTSTPFVTNFNTGSGYSFFKDGEEISQMDWNNRSVSDILPTYRWTIRSEEGNELTAGFDSKKAWYGGNSVKLSGVVGEGKTSSIKLYSADMPIDKKTIFTTTAMANTETELHLVLTFDDESQETIRGDKTVGTTWTTVNFKVSKFAGKNIRSIAYEMKPAAANEAYEFYFGNITVADKKSEEATEISNLTVDSAEFDENGTYAGVRLSWESDVQSGNYEIYSVNEDESVSFLGLSNVNCYYINGFRRPEGANVSRFMVVSVNCTQQEGEPLTTSIEWPDNSLPKADFKASQTLIGTGSTVTFTSACSENTESVSWSLPGASQERAEGNSVSVTYEKEGIYSVSVTAKNAAGEVTETAEGVICVSSDIEKDGELLLLSANKKTEATAYVNENERPELAVDGNYKTKWCATGTPPHSIVIDLGKEMTVSQVAIAHAKAGGESEDWNTRKYTISVSADGVEYTDVASVKSNTDANTLDTFAAVNARYVRLSVVKPTQGEDSAARIYEIEVYGLEEPLGVRSKETEF